MYLQDCLTIFAFMFFLWIALAYVIINVSVIAPNITVKIIAILAGSTAGIFSTTALIAVLVHLRKNRQKLYIEDILNSVQ